MTSLARYDQCFLFLFVLAYSTRVVFWNFGVPVTGQIQNFITKLHQTPRKSSLIPHESLNKKQKDYDKSK